jgi:hypothetical protein
MNDENPQVDTDEEEYEMWQFEHSINLAQEFIDEILFPQIDEFECENEDEKYVDGTLTFGLFCELVARLGEMGYTEEELHLHIKEYLNTSIGQVIH